MINRNRWQKINIKEMIDNYESKTKKNLSNLKKIGIYSFAKFSLSSDKIYSSVTIRHLWKSDKENIKENLLNNLFKKLDFEWFKKIEKFLKEKRIKIFKTGTNLSHLIEDPEIFKKNATSLIKQIIIYINKFIDFQKKNPKYKDFILQICISDKINSILKILNKEEDVILALNYLVKSEKIKIWTTEFLNKKIEFSNSILNKKNENTLYIKNIDILMFFVNFESNYFPIKIELCEEGGSRVLLGHDDGHRGIKEDQSLLGVSYKMYDDLKLLDLDLIRAIQC